jgi:rhamnosyltransferase
MSSYTSDTPDLYIALASFNGSAFIADQIDSIRNQSFTKWRLLIRDDGSSDGTVDIIRSYVSSDSRITLLEDDRKGLGPMGNFGALMKRALNEGASYLMFADQDDVWMERKIACQFKTIKRAEALHGHDSPILVHSDLAVSNEQMRVTSGSFMRYQRIRHEAVAPLNTLLTQNFVTGCTSIINGALLRMADPIPDEGLMHDWWLALCAAASGHIEYVPEPLVNYRQHGNNIIGAKGFWRMINPIKADVAHRWTVGSLHTLRTFAQARSLMGRLREIKPTPSKETLNLIEEYSTLLDRPRWERIKTVRRLGIRRQDRFRQCLLYLRLLMMSGRPMV